MRNISAVNDLESSGVLRSPRGLVLINGVSVQWLQIEVVTTTYYMADTYHVEIPLSSQPDGFDLTYLFSAEKLEIKIYLGYPLNPDSYNTNDLDLLMVGDVDRLVVDALEETASISGRDLTSRLIDSKTYEKYSNKTASDIAIILAEKHGLKPVVTPTKFKVGVFYKYQNTLLTRETTEWDLITFLSQQQDFVVYVEGYNLIFAPRKRNGADPYIINYTPQSFTNTSVIFPGMQLSLERSMTLSRDVKVKIRVPYSPQSSEAFTITVNSKRKGTSVRDAQTYVYTFPGLSRQQAIIRGNQIIRDITAQEIKFSATLPGDNALRKDSVIKLIGAGYPIDHLYYCDEVSRKLDFESGYIMTISAKNHSVDTEILE